MKNINLPIIILLFHLIIFLTGIIFVYFNIQIIGVPLMIIGLPLSALISLCIFGEKIKNLEIK